MRATFTHYPRSQSQLWAFRSEEMQKEEWNKKRKTEQKNAYEAKLSSQGHHLKKQNKKVVALSI